MITRFGRTMLRFRDPSGLNLLIVEDPSDTRKPVWQAPHRQCIEAHLPKYFH